VFRFVLVLAAAFWCGAALAADQPQYAPPPAWVKPAPIPAAPKTPASAAVQVLLTDRQMRLGVDVDEFYAETAFHILTPAGLTLVNGLSPSWNPETETLTFHKFNVLRDGQVIDLLGGGKKVTVVRREQNLELAMLDGDLTAVIQPEGLQVGDVVDLALTLTRRDPVMHGYSQAADALRHVGVAGRLRIRALWPSTKPIRWKTTDGMPSPKIEHSSDGDELTIDLTDAVAPNPPKGAPPRFADLGEIQLTQFKDWADVSSLMAPLYAKAESLAPDSPLRLEAQKIAASSTDPKVRAAAALRLVQDKVRYAFVGMSLGGYTPADADVTWVRRFGDCKGKTVLLLSLLNLLGVSAEPALVSTTAGDGLDARLPMMLFDHVIVRAQIAGKTYWLDGTRSGDRDLDAIEIPAFHWALPVQSAGAQLSPLTQPPLGQPGFESQLRLDASAGIDAAAPAHAEQLFRGDAAVGWNLILTASGHDEADRSMRDYWRGQLPWIDAKAVDFTYDDAQRVMRISMDGSANMDWSKDGAARYFQIADSSLGFEPAFKREPGLHADAPFAVNFPSFSTWTVVITLPNAGSGFGLMDAVDVDQTIAGVVYQRRTRLAGAVVTMTASERSLAPEFAASEAEADADALRLLADRDVTVRREMVAAADARETMDLGPTPADATGFSIQAAAYLERRDFSHAIADLDQAIKLAPTTAKYFYNRGVARFENQQDDQAMANFNQALRLDPSDAFALDARGELYLVRKDTKLAQADFAAAAKSAPNDVHRMHREADAYDETEHFDEEVGVYDQIIASAPTATHYNDRCWARAESGHDLEAALGDCATALKLEPNLFSAYDSRGFVELRLGRYDAAIKDYDAALQAASTQASSLFGRGIAELRKGDKLKAQNDIAAAKQAQPDIDATFAKLGVKP